MKIKFNKTNPKLSKLKLLIRIIPWSQLKNFNLNK